jgi:hypothetical protein
MFFPGESVRLVRDLPETTLSKGAHCEFARLLDGEQAEIRYYQGGSTQTATVPLPALEPLLSRSCEQRTAVLWHLENPPEEFLPAALDALRAHGLAIARGANVARLHYDHKELWWKRDEPFAAVVLDTRTIARDWHGWVVAFSGDERFHLEFRLKGRGEACVLLHEREEAYAGQTSNAAEATKLAQVLIDLSQAAGAAYCAFPVADPWQADEDWPALLRPPYSPDLFLFPGTALPKDFPEPFRGARLAGERVIVTALPVKFASTEEVSVPSERDHKLSALRKAHALAEKYYDQLYHAHGSTAGIYSDIKDAFLDAIVAAEALGLKEEAAALEKRLENVKGVYRSQFS